MKAKNVRKNLGKEVYIKVPLEEATNCSGKGLYVGERERLLKTPLTLYSDIDHDGDVVLRNIEGAEIFVHHKFIKLVKKDSTNEETN